MYSMDSNSKVFSHFTIFLMRVENSPIYYSSIFIGCSVSHLIRVPERVCDWCENYIHREAFKKYIADLFR